MTIPKQEQEGAVPSIFRPPVPTNPARSLPVANAVAVAPSAPSPSTRPPAYNPSAVQSSTVTTATASTIVHTNGKPPESAVRPTSTPITVGSGPRTCRVCEFAEDSNEDPLIVPCKCTGDRQWVHSRCMSKWRLYQHTNEFSQCGVCNFHYHLQGRQSCTKDDDNDNDTTRLKRWSKVRMIMAISSDFLLVTLFVQICCISLAAIVWAIDYNHVIAASLDGIESCVTHIEDSHFFCSNILSVYYMMGILCFLFCFGFTYCCCSRCDCFQHFCIAKNPPSVKETATPPMDTAKSASFYQRLRPKVSYDNNCCTNCEIAVGNACRKFSMRVGQLCRDMHYSLTPCCGDQNHGGHAGHYVGGTHHHHNSHHNNSGNNCNNNNNNSSGALGGGAPACGILGVFLFMLLVVFALMGFVVAMFIAVVLIQRIVQGRVYIIHKQRLVKEFPVMDLMGDADPEQHRPKLAEADLQSLRKVGLLVDGGHPY